MSIEGVDRVLANTLVAPQRTQGDQIADQTKAKTIEPEQAPAEKTSPPPLANQEKPHIEIEVPLAFDLSKNGLNIIGTLSQLRDSEVQEFLIVTARLLNVNHRSEGNGGQETAAPDPARATRRSFSHSGGQPYPEGPPAPRHLDYTG